MRDRQGEGVKIRKEKRHETRHLNFEFRRGEENSAKSSHYKKGEEGKTLKPQASTTGNHKKKNPISPRRTPTRRKEEKHFRRIQGGRSPISADGSVYWGGTASHVGAAPAS